MDWMYSSQILYVEALILNVMIFRGEAFEMYLSLYEVMQVKAPMMGLL